MVWIYDFLDINQLIPNPIRNMGLEVKSVSDQGGEAPQCRMERGTRLSQDRIARYAHRGHCATSELGVKAAAMLA